MSTQLYPEVIDGTTLNERKASDLFMPIGVEGEIASGGASAILTQHVISRPSVADTQFGAASPLALLVKYLLDLGVGPVVAVGAAKGTTPTLVQRQAAWQILEAEKSLRIRLTDSTVDADIAGLAVSAKNAALLNNKQFAIVGKAAATLKSAYLATADTIAADVDAAKRAVLVGPAVYDANGVLKTGVYAAASVAARLALNSDPGDDLDTATLPKLTGIERDAAGNNVFRVIVVGGTVVNDFEDLLQGGVSPLMPGINGGVAISHLRTTFQGDSTFDSLMTRIIVDEIFLLVRDYCENFNQLRKGNTETTREQLRSGVDAILRENSDLLQTITLGDGQTGYDVQVTASADGRQQIVSYQGVVVRGVSTIVVAANLTIPA
jgi:hypothetical protein